MCTRIGWELDEFSQKFFNFFCEINVSRYTMSNIQYVLLNSVYLCYKSFYSLLKTFWPEASALGEIFFFLSGWCTVMAFFDILLSFFLNNVIKPRKKNVFKRILNLQRSLSAIYSNLKSSGISSFWFGFTWMQIFRASEHLIRESSDVVLLRYKEKSCERYINNFFCMVANFDENR